VARSGGGFRGGGFVGTWVRLFRGRGVVGAEVKYRRRVDWLLGGGGDGFRGGGGIGARICLSEGT